MRQRTRSVWTLLLAATCLTGCDLSELEPLIDPPAGQAADRQPADRQAPNAGAEAETVEEAPLLADALSGLYYRNYSYYGGYPTPSYNLVENYYYFTADGRFYDGVPPGGLERFDWAKAERETPEKVGTYAIEGDRIVFTMLKGKSWDMTFERDKGRDLRLDGYFTSLRGAFRETRIEGVYYNGAFAAGKDSDSNLTSGRTLKLYADGTYEASRLSTFGAQVLGEASARGTYKLSGNTLILTGDDGNATYHTVFPFGEEADPANSPSILNVDGMSFVIEGRE